MRAAILLLAVVVAVAGAQQDLYEVLGIGRDAKQREIKKAFRKLSRTCHPDLHPNDPEKAEQFKTLSNAYETLLDEDKRQIYDLEGFEGLERHAQGGGGGGGFDPFGFPTGKPKGPTATLRLAVTLEELYNGGERTARIQRHVLCPKCRGTGAKDGKMKKCKVCGGRGHRLVNQRVGPGFTIQMQQPCNACGGRGQVHQHKCPHCSGHKVVEEEKELLATIERGMASDEEILFERAGEQQPGMIPGDVVFKLEARKHRLFERRGNDLYMTQRISLREALLGFDRSIRHLDGHSVSLSSNAITKPFQQRRLRKEGMPVHNFPAEHGDLYVTYEVNFPRTLSDSAKEELRKVLA
eukprot:PLAT4186.1.p1 GENE.PLAT4186.1~~PLAT4186.1.p1  ORF type:complete len:402 (+),score=113.79 PLAT4186.1:153-1208(+)